MMVMDWALLPHDLLYIISTKLADISDFIRFRDVCKSWQSSASPSDHAPRLPWILNNHGDLFVLANLKLCPSFSNKIYTIRVRHAYMMSLNGPSECYLLNTNKGRPISLLNPFTGNTIALPPLRKEIRSLYPLNFVGNRLRSKDLLVVRGFDKHSLTFILGLTRLGDAEWLVIPLPGSGVWVRGSFMYYKGHLFAHELSTGRTMVFDATSGKIAFTMRNTNRLDYNRDVKEYMLESEGKLLRIIKNIENNQVESFEIYQLDALDNDYRWIQIWDINEQMVFLDTHSGFSMRSSNFHGLRGNCIYFFHHEIVSSPLELSVQLCRYDLGNKEIRILPYPFNTKGAWIIPWIH
ncbi:hypothetical protein LUZ63_001983 [Rhynchospora breviuscula]|uniref:KIB1-4 beta-propeller domain-containing protein n=1 Tax=Rhynchospora breviuscula TaxID=2022672 RepID=A0A9Q0CXW5_9POAL|nr:hypothetical protein LUZ63_001983 [Rhynchospora breviuscula]